MEIGAVLLMQATSSPLASQVTPAYLTRVARAASIQLARDVAPLWGTAVDSCRVGSSPTDIQPGELAFAIVDQDNSAPGAIAYHDVQGNAVPFAVLELATCKTLQDVSTAITHELCESDGDVDCDVWVDTGQGKEVAQETCDAVESNFYTVDVDDELPPVPVSDFLLPAFFKQGAPGPYNFCATLAGDAQPRPSAPFATASGGYQLERDSGGNEQQVQGTALAGTPRPTRLARMLNAHSRAARRGWDRKQRAIASAEAVLEESKGALDELGEIETSITSRTHSLEANVLRFVRLWTKHLRGFRDELERRTDELKR